MNSIHENHNGLGPHSEPKMTQDKLSTFVAGVSMTTDQIIEAQRQRIQSIESKVAQAKISLNKWYANGGTKSGYEFIDEAIFALTQTEGEPSNAQRHSLHG